MNLADFAKFGFPADISSFTNFIFWCLGSAFDIIFIVLVLNVAFSILHEIIKHLIGGGRL